MSLLTTVKSATRAVNDELLGFKPFEKPRVIPHRRRVCYRPQQGSDAQSYSNFGDDPFYDIEGFPASSDDELDVPDVPLDSDDEAALEEEREARRCDALAEEAAKKEADSLALPLSLSGINPAATPPPPLPALTILHHPSPTNPTPSTHGFTAKPLGSLTWSPRHTALTTVAKNLPVFSSLARTTAADNGLRVTRTNHRVMHAIATSHPTTIDDMLPETDPLRQKLYEPTDMTDPGIDPSSRSIFKEPYDKTVLTVVDGDFDLLKNFKVTVLTPAMTQFAALPPTGGRLMGRGGVQFLAKGEHNVKRCFYTFNFDEYITNDQMEIDAMNTVRVIKEASIKHGKKVFRGSVVVNLTLEEMVRVQDTLGVDFGTMSDQERGTFMRANRVSVLGGVGREKEGLWKELKTLAGQKRNEEEEEEGSVHGSVVSELTTNEVMKGGRVDQLNLGHGSRGNELSLEEQSTTTVESIPRPVHQLAGSFAAGRFDEEGDAGSPAVNLDPETTPPTTADDEPASLADLRHLVSAVPPAAISSLTAAPFYEGVFLTWDHPDTTSAITKYVVEYTKVVHVSRQQKKEDENSNNFGNFEGVNGADDGDDKSLLTQDSSLDHQPPMEDSKTTITLSPPTTNSSPPNSVKIKDLSGGFDYLFSITAHSAVGVSPATKSRKVSPTSVVVATSKEELPIIFQRFGIDMSRAENVKQSLDTLWSRYQNNEFYLEVNTKKQLVMHVIRLDIFVQRTLEGKSDTEVVVETYCQKNDERLREINRVPHKIMRKGEHWQSAIRKILAEMFVVDEEDTKLVSFNQKMEKPVNSDLLPGLKCAQHNLKAFVTVQGLPPTSKFHTVRQIADGGGGSTVHHYFEWMDIHSYFVKVKNSLKSRRIDHGDSSDEGVKIENNIQVDPFGTALADEQGFPLSPNDPRRILVEQLVQNMYEGTDTLFYSVLSQIDSLNCLLQVQLFDGVGLSKETTLCKIGTAANIAMECKTFDKLDAFCPENVPVRLNEGKPVIMDSMGGIQLKLAVTNWVEYKTSDGAAKVDLVSTLGDVIAWEAERRVEQQHATEVKQEDDETSDSESTDEEDGIWAKDFELDDYFSMENLNNTADVRPFGDAMKVIAEVFGEILAQLSMTTASQDPTCDLVEDYQIRPLLKSVIIDKNRGDGSWPQVTRNDKEFVIRFYARIADAQKIPSQVPYYSEGPVIGPTPENFHGDSILLDSNAKLWFAGDTGKFIERGHVLSAICKFEVLLILDYLKLPVTIDDMNKATGANQIADWLTVSGDVALAIIHTRERGGKFASKEDLLARVSAANLTAVKAKVQELLVEPEERDEQLKQAAMFTNGLLCWHDLRKTARFKDVYSPRMELVWEMVTLLRRKLLLYCKTKTYSSVHHKTGLLSFFLRACSSSKKSSSQRQCAYNAVLQLSRVMLPEFFVQARLGMRHKSEFWDSTNATQRALSEEEFQMELVHYKIDCASKYSHVVDSFRHRSLEVMRHNVSLKPMSDFERGELSILHSEVSGRKIKDQLYATTQLRHWATSDNVEDEGITMLLGELFFNMQQQQNIDSPTSTRKAPKLLILGPSKSGKTVLCHKLMIRILASKQIKRDYKIVPVYISVNRLVMNYSKELEDAGSSLEESLRKMQGGGDKSKVAEGGEESEGGLRSRLNSTTSATSDAPDDSDVPEVDLIDAHFHQECSRFSRRYQALKRLQNSFKLLFIFDGMDEAGPMRDMIEQYVDDKLRSRHQMVIVTSKQPALNPSFFALYKWCGILPLSQNQQLDYAKRKLDFQNMPNHYQMLKNIDKVLSDKNFAKLATCPLMLSMMISLLDSSGTKTVAQLAPTPVVEPTTPKNGKKGGKKADEKVVAAPLPIVGADSGNKLPFHDKPSMFHLAIKMAVGHLDIANTSSTNQTADSKIDPNVTIHFLQKLAWFCHSNYTVDITSSKVVELLQMTSGGAASTDKSSLESALFRQVWNHLTGVIRTSNNKFEILVSTSYLSKFVGGKITSESVYQFSHSSFQEYLCAMELLERLQAEVDNNVTGVEACKRIFLQNPEIRGGAILHNFWWMNVVYFAASAAPTWLFRDMTKFLLMNDDDSASNATLCFELGRLRGDMVQIPRFRATQRLAACLSHHCVRVRRCALAEIQINSSYKIDVISSIVKLLDDDLTAAKNGKSKEQLHWYEKIAAVNSMVSLDAALYCVGSNRTMHQKIVELLSAMLASAEESETVKSLVLESIRSMGLQHEPQVRKTLVSMLKKKGMHSIRVLIRMISKMNVVDAHLLAIIASDLNDPPLRQDCEEALIELVSNSVWNVSTGAPSQTPMGSSMAAQTSIGNLAMATGGASFARGRKRGNIVVAQSFLPNEVMSLLFQIMALPNGDEARASASRVLGKCNVHDQLIPLFMMWMKKRTDSVVPCKTAADLEFPSLEMVSMLSLSFPVEKLLDWTNSEEKSFLLMEQCLDMMDCLIHGGANIGEMLSEENMVETGQILPKMLRCLNAADYETLQCRSVDALNACHLTQWEGVVEALLDVFIKDAKVAVKHKIADVLFHSSTERAVQMEGLYALKMWIRHRDLDMKLSCLDKIVELKLCNKTNIIVIGEYLKELFVDENAVVRARSLECMIAGDLVGQYLEGELDEFYDIVASLFQYDHDTDVKILAAKCLLEGVATESKSCSEVTQIIGGWAQNLNRFDLYEPAVRACISVPVNYWMNVDMTNSSKFKSFVVTQNLSVQSILKLLDSDVELRKVKLWVMRFVLHIAKEGFSLRLLSSLLDSLNFKRLEEVLASASANDEQSALDLLAISLDVMLAVFVPDQTPISDELVMRIQRLLKIHFDAGIRGRCCDLVLKFNMSTENIVSMITEEDAAWQGVALRSILKKKEFLLEDTELMDVLLSHVARMGSGNLILTLQIMQELDMGMLDDKHLDLIRTMMVALVGRIFLEFDHMHGGREGSHEDAHLSEWCLPAIAVIEKHTFLLSAVSMNHVNAERRRMSEGVENMSLSAQAVAQAEQDSRRKESVAGATTIVASKRLSETLMKLAQHEHAEPTVLKKVCGIFVSSIASGELVWLSGLVDALVKCKEPEMGVIILETLESITIGAEDSVKVLLKTVLGDAQARGFCFKPLIDFLGNLRAQEECEWSLPKSWADLVAKGMKEKVIEMAFLMKELRIGSMVSGGMFKKTTDIKMGGDRNYYTGAVFDPVCVTELYDKVHLEFNDGKDHVNYHDRRKSLLKQQRQVFRHLVVDGEGKVTTAGGGARYATISEALEEAEDGDEIHVYPKKDGGSYKERLVIEKSVVVKGMKNVYGVGGGGRSSSGGGGEGEEPEGGEGRARKESGSILDAVAGEGGKVSTGKALGEMVQSLKDEGAKEEEDLKKREYDAVMKSKGKKVEKKHVLVEFYDVGEEEPVIRCCGKDVKLVNLTVQHKGPDNLACIFVGFGTLTCQQMRLYSEGGDGVYVTQGGALVAKQSCHFGPCKRNGVLVEGLCSGVDVSDCEIRGNKQCGVKVLGGAEVILKRNRINGNDLHGVSIGLKCPADLMQNSFENNKDTHLFINAKWFPKEKDMININNSESDDDYRVASRLNTIKSTKTWSKGRRYSLHGTQAFMDVLGNDDMAA